MKFNIPDTSQKGVVIVGGDFGGLTLARKLAKSDFQVVLIDKNNYHQFHPLFYQVAMAGLEPSSIFFPFRKVFQKSKLIVFLNWVWNYITYDQSLRLVIKLWRRNT